MKYFDLPPFKELIDNWDAHLSTFWVPALVGLIFAGLAVRELIQGHIRLFVLYLFLTLCCIGYVACGDVIMNNLSGLIH